jgi:hypothetical protein
MSAMISRRYRTRTLVLAAVVGVVVAGGAGYAAAAGSSAADQHRAGSATSPTAAGSTTQGPCKAGYDDETSTLTPPDDSTIDNPPAASVSFKKQCAGLVIVRFSGEYTGPSTSSFIHMDLRATCTATGGTSTPCTVGQVVFGQPGHTFFQNGQSSVGVRTMQWVFPALKRGVWKFDALPGGGGSASLGFRTLTVEAWNGG